MLSKKSLFKKISTLALAGIFVLSLYGTSIACRMYGAISDDLPDGLLQDHLIGDAINFPDSLKRLAQTGNIDGWGIAYYPYYLLDYNFNDSADSADLRTDSSGQDWYESRGDVPTLLTLDETDVAGNSTKKAKLTASTSGNAYLSQEFSTPQTDTFTVQWDIYLDEIIDSANPDRSAYMLIGDDADGIRGPNSTNGDRFVYMAFYKEGGGTTGTMNLVARQPADSWGGGLFTQIATGLNLDQWYTIKVEIDVINNTYDIYVNGILEGDDIQARVSKTSLTHISFATWNDGPGTFYVDNVWDTIERGAERAYTDTAYDAVVNHINTIEPTITMAHVRYCTAGCCDHGGETIPDPHPFYRYKNEKRWTFSHNGGVSTSLLESLIGTAYLNENPPNGSDIPECEGNVVDSELYFLYILKTIEENGWNTVNGIVEATMTMIDNGETGGMNFIMSDGSKMWAFCKGRTLDYIYDASNGYSAVASQYPSSTRGDWIAMNDYELAVLTTDAAPDVIDVTNYTPEDDLLVDSEFDDSTDSADLRTDGSGQDWYESRGDVPTLLTLDETDVAGNSTKKAKLTASTSGNAYLSQEFSTPQTDTFTVQWDIYLDEIIDSGNPDRSAYMLIGDDADGIRGPNSTNGDRFVYMAFYKEGGGTTGTMNLVARQPADSWGGGLFTQIATGLNLDQWYTIKVEIDVINNTYDIYVNGILEGDDIQARVSKTSLTHISFATWNDGPGTFYVDNVFSPAPEVECTIDEDCDDSNDCTDDSCVSGSCVYTNNNNPCDDSNACTENDTCSDGSCQGTAIDCSDGNICTDDDCDPASGCFYINNTDPCDDGEFCNGNDTCSGGTCSDHAGNPCTPPLVCDEGSDTCVGCIDDADCDDSNNCTDDSCVSGSCVYTNNSDPCDDSNACTENDMCSDGSCQGTAIDCSDGNICTDDDCDPSSGCFYTNNTDPCDDGIYCNGSDTCSDGGCSDHSGNPCTPPLLCDEGSDTCVALGDELLVDTEFDDSTDSTDLRVDSPDQDWYESREDDPALLTLNQEEIGGNTSKKARLEASSSSNAYLSQEFSTPQTGTFSVLWDIYIDEILDISAPDRAGFMLIGDESHTDSPGPNSDNSERFVYMAFLKDGGGTTGTMDLVARDRDDDWTSFTTIAPGLNLDQWYTIKVVCDLDSDTYDIYVDGAFTATVTSRNAKTSVTHISFAQWNDGAGTFYVDNVEAVSSSITADFSADITSGDAPLTVTFTDLSTGSIDTWSWDFDNDGIEDSNDQNPPSHTYNIPGIYTVVLEVSGPGGTDTETKVSYITVSGPLPSLYVSPAYIDFRGTGNERIISIINIGDEIFDWTANPLDPWIGVSEPSGFTLLPGQSYPIIVTIDRDLISFGGSLPDTNCRFWGIVSDNMPAGVIENHLINDSNSLENLSSSTNRNGWVIGYYPECGDIPTIERGIPAAIDDPDFDTAVSTLESVQSNIAVAHIRNCTQGCCINPAVPDPHAFYRDKNGKTWLFGHNGNVSQTLLDSLLGDYLINNPINGSGIPECVDSPVDSEKYFLLLLKHFEENGWQVEEGIIEATNVLRANGQTTLNFFLTNGQTLWAYKHGHDLAYIYNEVEGFSAIASQPPNTDENWHVLEENGTLVILNPGLSPELVNTIDTPEALGTIHVEAIDPLTQTTFEFKDIMVAANSLPPEPTFISLTPDSASSTVGDPIDFTLVVGDGDGYEDLTSVRFVIKQGIGTGTSSDAIILEYRSYRPERIWMWNHDEGIWNWAEMGTSTVLEDSLSSLDVSQTSLTGDGDILTINYNITPKAAFIGDPLNSDKRIWLRVKDLVNTLGDLEIGSWTVTASSGCVDDPDCDDGVFCNGSETCVDGTCQPGTDPCPGQMCDEANDACADCLIDPDCDDGLFCNGDETCIDGTCQPGTDPCPPPLTCDEDTNTCLGCIIDEDCDDGVDCTIDSCIDSSCQNTTDDTFCDDGSYCNGEETCDASTGCQAGSDPCPGQICDEDNDQCEGTLPTEPTFISLTPDSASSTVGDPIDFTLVVGDGDGYEDLTSVRFVIKQGIGTGTSSDAIILEYRSYRPERIWMWNHDEGIWNWAEMGTSTVLEDSLSSLDVSQTSLTGDGDILTINYNITPKAAFIGDPLNSDKRIWLRVKDIDGNIFGNEEIGSWTVTD